MVVSGTDVAMTTTFTGWLATPSPIQDWFYLHINYSVNLMSLDMKCSMARIKASAKAIATSKIRGKEGGRSRAASPSS